MSDHQASAEPTISSHKDCVTALAATTFDLGCKLDEVIRTQSRLEAKVDRHEATLEQHGGALARIETMLVKIIEGQSVLHQNDMELKRRLDAIGVK